MNPKTFQNILCSATTFFFILVVHLSAWAKLSIPHESYVLDNGLHVILHQDRSLPKVVVNLWYHVGSKDEKKRRSGFAHLFEHLMFMGTQNVPDGQFDILMEKLGAKNNATTSFDRTNYFSWGDSQALPVLLWLEADRMYALGDNMTQEKLDLQRKVVRNERRQDDENQPYGMLMTTMIQNIFPKDHPYWGTVIGSHEDLEKATVEDVKDFFREYYRPDNASLVVAGDFDLAEAKKWIDQYFAWIPRGKTPLSKAKAYAGKWPRSYKSISLKDEVSLPLLTLNYRSPKANAKGDAEMDLVASLLTGGKSSRLYQALKVKKDWVQSVGAYQISSELDSMFTIRAFIKPGIPIDSVKKVMDQEIQKLIEEEIADQELSRVKKQYESSSVWSLEGLLHRADELNYCQYHYKKADCLEENLQRYLLASPSQVQSWAKNVFSSTRLEIRILPKGNAS
ncbi:MAG: insulinase family protein [Bdellovibrionales bacterium]|nr:insulinase family protein [Bdellovibrionales bacterium]